MGAMASRWRNAVTTAGRVTPAQRWRTELAENVRDAAGASSFAAVLTSASGQLGRVQLDCAPFDFSPVMQRIVAFAPRIEAAGEGWEFAIRAHGLVYTPLECAIHTDIAADINDKVLIPAGVHGYVVSWLVDPTRGFLGSIIMGATARSRTFFADTEGPLVDVCTAAASTLSSAIDLAEACGARFPASPTRWSAGLTARQAQIASLAADGLSNLNVASRLGISEQTVSRRTVASGSAAGSAMHSRQAEAGEPTGGRRLAERDQGPGREGFGLGPGRRCWTTTASSSSRILP